VCTSALSKGDEISCLARAIYTEARGESLYGRLLVGWVIRNRVKSSKFPNTYCKVVYQRRQFAGIRNKVIKDSRQYRDSYNIAMYIIGAERLSIPKNMLYYHHAN